jgi:UDP-N-acetylmuramoyl-tripeptide--D-alanyl-D-alanine ligase
MAAATGGKLLAPFAVNGISIDTRSLQPGNLFVALKDVRDGHDFIDAAFAAGAEGCLVERDPGPDRPGVLVPDVLEALVAMGVARRNANDGVIAAITGSAGKTSVKEMLARIYRAAGRAHWSDKSFNNHWGVPLTLARMPADTERAIFEIGMNSPGEIAPRSHMVRPHVAMITRIAPAHLEGMGSVEGVADEKSDIFSGLEPGGAIIVPARDYFCERLKLAGLRRQPSGEVFFFGGEAGKNAATAIDYQTDGVTSRVRVDVMGEVVDVHLNAVGPHWATNAALALLAASLSNVSAKHAAEALSGYAPPAGRGVAEKLKLPDGGEITLVDDSYNANPDSMRAALEGLAERPGRKIIALGEMRELGHDSAALHAGLAGPIVAAGVSKAVLSGAEMSHLAREIVSRNGAIEVVHVSNPGDAVEQVKSWLKTGDALLIKGSNASGMGRVGSQLREWSGAGVKPQKAGGA